MRDEFDAGIPENLNALADRLRGWQPSSGGLDRDRLIFEAGRAAGLAEARTTYRKRFWPMAMATAASLLVAASVLLTRNPERKETPERIEMAKIPQHSQPLPETAPITPVDPNSYLALARRIADGILDPAPTDRVRSGSDLPNPVDHSTPLRARDLDRLLNL